MKAARLPQVPLVQHYWAGETFRCLGAGVRVKKIAIINVKARGIGHDDGCHTAACDESSVSHMKIVCRTLASTRVWRW